MDSRPGQPPRSLPVAWATAVGLGALAGVATWLANALIVSRFPDAVRPDDLLFELLPYVGPARWLTLAALAAGIGAFLWITLRTAPSTLPAAGTAVALLYLLRAGVMVLTPLAPAYSEGHFVFQQVQYGTFPSGHTALLTMLALLVPVEQHRDETQLKRPRHAGGASRKNARVAVRLRAWGAC